MAITYPDFLKSTDKRRKVADALAHALCMILGEKGDAIRDEDRISYWLPPKGQERLILRTSECGRTAYALYYYFGVPNLTVVNSTTELPISSQRPDLPLPPFRHVFLMDPSNRKVTDPTYSQVLRWHSITPQRNPAKFGDLPEIAVFNLEEIAPFCQTIRNVAAKHASTIPTGSVLFQDEPRDTGAYSRQSLFTTYRRIWRHANMSPDSLTAPRTQLEARRMAEIMREKTGG